MGLWEFQVANALTGEVYDELTDARTRKVSLPLRRLSGGSFVVDANNALAPYLRLKDKTLIKAYRNKQLLGLGPITQFNKTRNSGGGTIAVNWASAGWRIGKRTIEASKVPSGITYGTPSVFTSKGAIATSIINGLNTAPLVVTIAGNSIQVVNVANPAPGGQINPLPQSDTGIRIGNVATDIATTYVGPWFYKNAMEALIEISGPLDGFDWQIVPVEPTLDSIGLWVGTFNASVAIGATRLDSVFEFGDGKRNVASFTEVGDSEGLLNRAYSLPQSFPDNASGQPFMQYDYAAILERGFVYEDVLPSDLVTDDMRNKLLQANMTVRSQPKTVITFQPTVDKTTGVLPQYGTEFVEGDIVPFRAVEYGDETVNGLFRIYRVDFDIDDNGEEAATPTLVESDS